nr:MAG TPA: hypothetical protein [Caudoviricetes sp.]
MLHPGAEFKMLSQNDLLSNGKMPPLPAGAGRGGNVASGCRIFHQAPSGAIFRTRVWFSVPGIN